MTPFDRVSRIMPAESVRGDDASDMVPGSLDGAQGQINRSALQTELAVERTILAVERTYDAWVRTGLAALASGVGARALLTGIVPIWLSRSAGVMLVLFAAFCFMVGAWREISTSAQLPTPRIRHLPPLILVVINGFLVLVALTTLAGVVATP